MHHYSFVDEIQMNHGPAGLLGRFLLLADQLTKERGVTLRIEPIATLAEVNRQNRNSWAALFPGLDVNYSDLDDTNSLCFIGRNHKGEAVVAQAARLYDFQNKSFSDASRDLSALYSNPSEFEARGEACKVTAWAGRLITGRVAYSGATWVRPDLRGNGLVNVLPRLSRTAATALWGPDCIFGMMAESLVKAGLLRSNGFRNLEWSVELKSPTIGDYKFALLWMKPTDVLDDLMDVLSDRDVSQLAEAKSARSA